MASNAKAYPSMTKFRPASDEHAVHHAVVGVRLQGPTNNENYDLAVALATELVRTNLPGKVQLDPLAMVFGRQVISPGLAGSGDFNPGWLFQRTNDAGEMQEELTLERSALTYRTSSYQRWDNVQKIIDEIIVPVAQKMSQDDKTRLSVIELRCIDKFLASDLDTTLEGLVKPDTPYIPREVINKNEMLHCHLGWFEDRDDTGRLLINLNVDVVDTPEAGRAANVLQVLSQQSASGGVRFEKSGSFEEVVKDTFLYLHKFDKYILSELLSDEMQDQIQLKGRRGVDKP